ncbi:MAG: molybdopterin molybdotransferase MoeA [Trebonia sp.]|jgi:putative molybdopterin biosynthesis protein
MSPASSAQPRPALAYARWLDSLARAGWDAEPATERVAVTSALGRVSAGPIVARWPSPRSDCSAMDGIAVPFAILTAATSATTPATGGDAGASTTGAGSGVRLPAGTFEWIDTGDAMPDGADTVVMRERLLPQEDGDVVIGAVAGPRELARGNNVRRAGEDFAAGETLVPAGRRLRPGDLAAAAACGHESVAVTRPPVVAIIPTGDEIRPAGSAVRAGEILDTNSLMLAGRCRQVGAVPVVSDVQPDDPDTLAAGIRRAARGADLVLIIAGSSRGRDDHANAVLAQVGGVAVAGVAVRPGHPALLGHAKRSLSGIAPVIGLPGYPLAAAVIFELFAVPLLAAISGLRKRAGPRPLATLDRDWTSRPGIEDWVLVTLAPSVGASAGPLADPAACPREGWGAGAPQAGALPVATPARRGAGSTSQLARADAWWPIPPDRLAFTAGAVIEVRPIPD